MTVENKVRVMKKIAVVLAVLAAVCMASGCRTYYANLDNPSRNSQRFWQIDYNYCNAVAIGKAPIPQVSFQGNTYANTTGTFNTPNYYGTYQQQTVYTNDMQTVNNMFALTALMQANQAQNSIREACLGVLGWTQVSKEEYNRHWQGQQNQQNNLQKKNDTSSRSDTRAPSNDSAEKEKKKISDWQSYVVEHSDGTRMFMMSTKGKNYNSEFFMGTGSGAPLFNIIFFFYNNKKISGKIADCRIIVDGVSIAPHWNESKIQYGGYNVAAILYEFPIIESDVKFGAKVIESLKRGSEMRLTIKNTEIDETYSLNGFSGSFERIKTMRRR